MYVYGDGTITSVARLQRHRYLSETYRKAAAQPWLPVEPDPPEPQ
jgi:hypothetical protein